MTGLKDAVYALEEQAEGRTPERSCLLAGALALDTLVRRGEQDRDILDAAAGQWSMMPATSPNVMVLFGNNRRLYPLPDDKRSSAQHCKRLRSERQKS
jgi:hypothetical protein